MVTPPRRYVVLLHTGHGDDHFDLMLEADPDGPLLTWRCSAWPSDAATQFAPLPPHRRAYLDYEGDISDGRGRVSRVAAGDYSLEDGDGISEAGALLTVRIQGRLLSLPKGVRQNRA